MYPIKPSEISVLYEDAIMLLKQLTATPSFSKEEEASAALIQDFFVGKNIAAKRMMNNVWAKNKYYNEQRPTILLNSHHDTVRPDKAYTNDPFQAIDDNGKLYGLGSNDAGASLVALLSVFLYFYEQEGLKYNLIFAASAEEEISGKNGIEALLKEMPPIDFAIVGEPTQMEMAIAEKGLMVLDCTAKGEAGHAARNEGDNAIYKALKDIEWFRMYEFPEVSPLLGPVKMSVTVINSGTQHNVVPAECRFTVDVRVNECYTLEEVLEIIKQHVACEVIPRSMRLKPSSIPLEHPVVQRGAKLDRKYFGSATMSDRALMPFPALKMGPGDSARSHTADEYVFTDEIKEGIDIYIKLLKELL